MSISLNKLFSMFSTEDDTEIVSVRVGDLKRLIDEKNTAQAQASNYKDTINVLKEQQRILTKELDELDAIISETATIRVENIVMKKGLKKLEDKLDLANSLIVSKNARLTMCEIEQPLLVDIYG